MYSTKQPVFTEQNSSISTLFCLSHIRRILKTLYQVIEDDAGAAMPEVPISLDIPGVFTVHIKITNLIIELMFKIH